MAQKSGATKSKPHALVTGASAGIGTAFAERLARDGHDLTLVARSRDRLDVVAKKLHRDHKVAVHVLPADLTSAGDLHRIEQHIEKDTSLELLVNNAGFGTMGRFAELDPEREENEIRLNVLALVRLTRAALGGMVQRGRGAIINVSSLAAFQPGPYTATYSATKAYVNSFTEALYEELRDTGVRVQVLCPGFTRTEFQERANIDVTEIPSFAWMSAESVVGASLDGLRRGELVCVPGLGNRVVASVTGAMPRFLARRVAATLGRRMKVA